MVVDSEIQWLVIDVRIAVRKLRMLIVGLSCDPCLDGAMNQRAFRNLARKRSAERRHPSPKPTFTLLSAVPYPTWHPFGTLPTSGHGVMGQSNPVSRDIGGRSILVCCTDVIDAKAAGYRLSQHPAQSNAG